MTETAQQPSTFVFWTDVQGMSLSMTVPSGEKALLLITFSSAAFCHDGVNATAFCRVCASWSMGSTGPAEPGDLRLSTTDGNVDSSTEVHSMQFVAGPLNAGQHTIKVQGAVSEDTVVLWHLVPHSERASIEGLGEHLRPRVGGGTYWRLTSP